MRLPARLIATAVAAPSLLLLAHGAPREPVPPGREWRTHGGDPGHTQFSPLDQIDTSNVARLEVAWTYTTGDAREGRTQIQCNPIVVDGVLYATSPRVDTFALDAATRSGSVNDFFRFSATAGARRGDDAWSP